MADKMIVRQPHEGDAYWVLGGLYEVKAASTETGGGMTVMQMTMPAGAGPMPHTHPGAEALYVLSGKIRHHMSGDVVEAGPGSFFYIPSGTLEWFEPLELTTVLVTYTPGGGIESFFAEIGVEATKRELPPPSKEPPDLQRIAEIGERYGMQVQLPA